jgi:hypothetical protein
MQKNQSSVFLRMREEVGVKGAEKGREERGLVREEEYEVRYREGEGLGMRGI